MESLLPSDRFDQGVMDRFLNYSELPILGSTALEQILHSSLAGDHHPQYTAVMSPDSSQWTASTSGVESGSESPDEHNDDLDCLPDSTTERDIDTMSVNSDPLNSSGSEYSFAASPPAFEPLLQEDFQFEKGLKRKHVNSESSESCKKRSRKSKIGPTDLMCPLCDYTTRVKEHLGSHMNSHASERKYMCNQCGQTFKWSHSLRRHQRTHTKEYKYTCTYCPKSFSRKDHLAVHEKLHDSDNSESFPCLECGTTFKNKKTLTGHLKTHSSDKPYKCGSCESEFTRKASLTRHVLAAHAGQVFHCDICHAPFSYKSTLEDHRRAVHNSGKRDFHCTGCGLSFACKAYLQKHMGVCKQRADRSDVPCPECGVKFPTRRHVQEHRRSTHKRANSLQQTQNIGHSVGQYFDNNGGVCSTPLPSFSPGLQGYEDRLNTPMYASRCEVCHAFFENQTALEAHFLSHVSQNPCLTPLDPLLNQPPVGVDLPLTQLEGEPIEENFGSILRQVYESEHSEFGSKNSGNNYISHMTMLYDLL